ncbi:hypothetical protein [Piscinibacter sakaiensis]|uniref:hypothetical protein n=1 Tax=Piscinibacter sakaiensis TaxID=1547922 RepID=UPI003AABACD1
MVGDKFFSLTLVAQDGIGAGQNVSFAYRITNKSAFNANNIVVNDDKLGLISGSPFSLAPGASHTLTANGLITQTTSNIATATSDACLAGTKATATVTVLQPPPCSVKQALYKIEDDKYKLKITNPGNTMVTLDTFVLNWPVGATYGAIKEIKLDGAIYKADRSPLAVTSGVTISSSNWTEAQVSKRQLDPGETRTLEVSFTSKYKKENCPGGTCLSGTATFVQGCSLELGQ